MRFSQICVFSTCSDSSATQHYDNSCQVVLLLELVVSEVNLLMEEGAVNRWEVCEASIHYSALQFCSIKVEMELLVHSTSSKAMLSGDGAAGT